jgi:hypothetical protein
MAKDMGQKLRTIPLGRQREPEMMPIRLCRVRNSWLRLAMGAMLAERGTAALIILDDALVYCDDDRIQRMFDALSRAGKHQQIIVLTCRLLRSFGQPFCCQVSNFIQTTARHRRYPLRH